MSDSNRSRRTTTRQRTDLKPSPPGSTEHGELKRLWDKHQADDSKIKRPWELFDDDLPDQQRRSPIGGSTRSQEQAPAQRAPTQPLPRPVNNDEPAAQRTPTRPLPRPAYNNDEPPTQRGATRPLPRPGRELLDDAPAPTYVSPISETRAAMDHAEYLYAPRDIGNVGRTLPLYGELQRRPWLMLIIAGASIAVIVWLFMAPVRQSFYVEHAPATRDISGPVAAQPAPNGEHSIVGAPTLNAEQIDHVLQSYGSPAEGTGSDWVTLGQRYGIDPAYALAFFVVESTAGTAPGWAGWKEDGSSTHNIGNIICAGYPTCHGRFRDYATWQEGIEDWYKLIAVEYIQGRNVQTVEQIIPIYAPSFENDVPAYVNNVETMVTRWRAGGGK